MKKFYTDPLAAAYMAREFGVKFTDADGDEIRCANNIAKGLWSWIYKGESKSDWIYYSGTPIKLPCGKITEDVKYYIHPDSYYGFRPMPGDVIYRTPRRSDKESHGLIVCKPRSCSHWESRIKENKDDIKIFQRNNKTFFWPESEEE